jgi:hypothetical protein
MDFRQNATVTNNLERHSPQPEQLQYSNVGIDGLFPDLGVTHKYETDFSRVDYGYGTDDMNTTCTGLTPNTQRKAQDTLDTSMLPQYDGAPSVSNVYDNDFSGSSFAYPDPQAAAAAAAAVTGPYGDPDLYNLSHDLDIPGGEQTFTATDNHIDQYFSQDQPKFGSADRVDYSFPNFNLNNQTPASNTVPFTARTGRPLTNPSTDQDVTQAMVSAGPAPLEAARRGRRRRIASIGSRDTPDPSRLKKNCAGCNKGFYNSKDPDGLRCTRCYEKHVKHTAGHTTYVFDPNMTIDLAWRRLYPQVQPLALAGDDVAASRGDEEEYVRRLIEAVSSPYRSNGTDTKEDHQRCVQQVKLNKKPFDSTQYRHDLVNARIRFLFHIALSYHAGGPSLYDTGGDNSGYGEDRTMKFSDRMERIIQLLTYDKDIAMDVVEGRGVTALVHNPNKYERRKRDNKKSNDTKQDLQQKGKQMHMLQSRASASPAPPLEPTLDQVNMQAQLSGYGPGVAYTALSDLVRQGPGESGAMVSYGPDDGYRDLGLNQADFDGYMPAQFQ